MWAQKPVIRCYKWSEITPISKVITPVTQLFLAIYMGYNSIYNSCFGPPWRVLPILTFLRHQDSAREDIRLRIRRNARTAEPATACVTGLGMFATWYLDSTWRIIPISG